MLAIRKTDTTDSPDDLDDRQNRQSIELLRSMNITIGVRLKHFHMEVIRAINQSVRIVIIGYNK